MSPVRRSLIAWSGGLGLAALIGISFLMPVSFMLNWVDRVPGLARLYCPESGKIAPRYFTPRSSKKSEPIACLNAKGERVRDWSVHSIMIWSVSAFWTLILLWPFRALAILFLDGRNTGLSSRRRR